MSMYERTQLLFGQQAIKTLKTKSVIIFGVGGVGGVVAEQLVRTGVGNLTIVDFDVVTKSNLNRQIIALNSTIGKYKVEVLKQRLLDINPNLNITALNKMYDKDTKDQFDLKSYDYVVDAIDTVMQKIDLIIDAKTRGANLISAMGTGNRNTIPSFEVGDIFDTTYDGLARKIRHILRKNNITSLKVVYTTEKPKPHSPAGSVVYYPAVCGSLIASKIISDFVQKDQN